MYLSQQLEHVFKLFGLAISRDKRNISQVMADIAENHKERDFKQLYNLLRNQEVYIPINSDSLPDGSHNGDEYKSEVTDSDSIYIYRILGPNNQTLIPAALDLSCSILKNGFMKMSWINFLDMIYQKTDIEGATLEGKSSWVKFGGDRIKAILKQYKV